MKNQFNEFVRELCTKFSREIAAMKGFQKKGFSVEKLCEGLCSPKTLQNLQNGSRNLDKLLQDEILGRLGVAAEDYEYLLSYDEYCRWKARELILHNITWNQPEEAGRLLEDYRKRYDMGKRLERQFVLSMEARIQYLLGAGRSILSALFEEAANLTIPSLQENKIADLVLSARELNLLLEAERWREGGGRPKRYGEIVDYLEGSGWDRRGMAKLYPKAVYLLCASLMEESHMEGGMMKERHMEEGHAGKVHMEEGLIEKCIGERETGKGCRWGKAGLLRCCNLGIEILRDNERMYYLWELLSMREKLLDEMQRELIGRGEQRRAGSLEGMRRENREYLQVLEKTYSEFHVPVETFHDCCLYVVNGVSCVNDVIRCRREMLGMSRKELYEGICSEKTLGRLERCETSMQKEIAALLLERLGLPGEFTRTELVTDSLEARQLMEMLRYQARRKNWNEVDRLREEIGNLVDQEIVCNWQVLKRCEVLSLRGQKKITNQEYREQMLEILEMTLPLEAFLKEGEKYLTDEEQSCIQNLMLVMDAGSEEYSTCLRRFEEMYQPYFDEGVQDSIPGMCEFIMGYVGSEYGNRGNYDRADIHSERIYTGSLWLRRMPQLCYSLYDRWWNDAQRKQKGIPAKHDLDDMEELTRCMMIAKLSKQHNRAEFFQQVMERLGEK